MMSQLRNKPAGSEPGAPLGPQVGADGPSPRRVFIVGSVVIVAFVALLLGGIRIFLFPIWEANSEGVRQVATAQAQISAARTREALTPLPTPTVLAAAPALPTTAPTMAPTPAPTAVPRPTVQATVGRVAVGTLDALATTTPVALPTVAPELESDIAAAYEKFFQVSSDALLNLDSTSVSQVAAGQALNDVEQTIESDRAQGRALQTNVLHEYVVLGVQDDQAAVADRYRDSSIYVDPNTHEPLPDQVVPASPDVAPLVVAIYHFQRVDGVWKVVGVESSR